MTRNHGGEPNELSVKVGRSLAGYAGFDGSPGVVTFVRLERTKRTRERSFPSASLSLSLLSVSAAITSGITRSPLLVLSASKYLLIQETNSEESDIVAPTTLFPRGEKNSPVGKRNQPTFQNSVDIQLRATKR